jgi:hypothetical protein
VGDDSLGDAWKANVKGLPEVVAQRLVIHDTQEDAFYEELQQSVRLVLSSPPFHIATTLLGYSIPCSKMVEATLARSATDMRPSHGGLLRATSSELAHPGLLPVVGASKELANDEDGTIDYLLVSKKCVLRPCRVLQACRAADARFVAWPQQGTT